MPMIVPARPPRHAVTPAPRAAQANNTLLPIAFHSMHGMGDNLHQRALVRRLMTSSTVYIDTPWPSIYHDLVGPKLVLVRPAAATLRTQAKNLVREASLYHTSLMPRPARSVGTWYTPEEVRQFGSVLGAMAASVKLGGELDFRMPVPVRWQTALDAKVLLPTTKPIMFYRPLVSRTEWGGCDSRNPEYDAYRDLYEAVRERFYVVSVADLEPRKEWLVGHPADVDLTLHRGELSFELLAALAARAALVFCSPGFAIPLAQAVGTPVVCVFGGYENSSSFSAGAKFTSTLGINPITPCSCFSHTHAHRKAIDMPSALHRLQDFAWKIEDAHRTFRRIAAAYARHRLAESPQTLHESGGVGDDCSASP